MNPARELRDGVCSEMRAVADALVGQIKEDLDIHSPSKLIADRGEECPDVVPVPVPVREEGPAR